MLTQSACQSNFVEFTPTAENIGLMKEYLEQSINKFESKTSHC